MCTLSKVIEKIQQQGNHICIFFLNPLCSSLHFQSPESVFYTNFTSFAFLCSAFPSIILFQCFYLHAFVSWNSLKPRLSWCRYGVKMSTALWTWPVPPPPCLCVILSRDLLPTWPCWISAICFTALAFKCLIEPLISWTVAECVRKSRGRPKDGGSVYKRWRYACLKYDERMWWSNQPRPYICPADALLQFTHLHCLMYAIISIPKTCMHTSTTVIYVYPYTDSHSSPTHTYNT